MSRIGNRPINVPEGVMIQITPKKIEASFGDKTDFIPVPYGFTAEIKNNFVIIQRPNNTKESKSLHGLTARLANNLFIGVKDGFTKELEFNGTGYRVAVNGDEIVLNMGYSHEMKLTIPLGITISIKKNTIIVTGHNKQKVGQIAARIREVKKPEVYKGKGIKYKDEVIKRKTGKKAASV